MPADVRVQRLQLGVLVLLAACAADGAAVGAAAPGCTIVEQPASLPAVLNEDERARRKPERAGHLLDAQRFRR